jgi:hypothetical protein
MFTGPVAQSVQWLATGSTVLGSNYGGGRQSPRPAAEQYQSAMDYDCNK